MTQWNWYWGTDRETADSVHLQGREAKGDLKSNGSACWWEIVTESEARHEKERRGGRLCSKWRTTCTHRLHSLSRTLAGCGEGRTHAPMNHGTYSPGLQHRLSFSDGVGESAVGKSITPSTAVSHCSAVAFNNKLQQWDDSRSHNNTKLGGWTPAEQRLC